MSVSWPVKSEGNGLGEEDSTSFPFINARPSPFCAGFSTSVSFTTDLHPVRGSISNKRRQRLIF